MPIQDLHTDYESYRDQWGRIRDAIAGQDAVHRQGEKYLPRLGGQDGTEYNAYRQRAPWYNATGRTVEGLTGMLFRKPPQVTAPTALEPFLDDITQSGLTLADLAEQVAEEVVSLGRGGVLVDFPPKPKGIITRTQAEAAGLRPYLATYTAENIRNWKLGRVAGRTQPVQVVLEETVPTPEPEDKFDTSTIRQFRVLELTEEGYVVELWREVQEGKWELVESTMPRMNGRPLKYIPFIFVSPRDTTERVVKPPIIDLVDTNFSHYQTAADLEHGAHYTALPTPIVTGHSSTVDADGNEEELKIGAGTAWVFSEPEAKVYMLEFQGNGLDTLVARLEKKEQQMAALGARMLSPEKKQAEAAETAAIHRMGEISVLASTAHALSRALTRAVEIMAEWAGISGEIEIEVNSDFLPQGMTPQDLTALVQAWQAGALSFEDLFQNLQRGEIIGHDRTAADVKAEVDADPPLAMMAGMKALEDDPEDEDEEENA